MKHEIKLYGPIDSYWNSAEEIVGNIPADAKEITMRIHSPGGSVGEGLAIYNALRDHSAKVTTIVDGYAASTASFLMLAGDVRQVHRNSIIFVHNPWTVAQGDADDLRKTADGLDVHAEAILDIYKQRTGMDEAEIKDMMDETMFFRGVNAKDNGFATEIIDDVEADNRIAAMLELDSFVAQTKGIQMSKQKPRKEIEADLVAKDEELVQARADIDALKTANETGIAEIEAKHVEAIEAKDVELVEAKAELETANESITAFEAKIVEADEAKALIDAELVTAKAEIETVKADLESAQNTLKNPAVADARLKAVKAGDLPKSQADIEADEAEARAIEEAGEGKSESPCYDEYRELMNGGESRRARAYFRDHQKEINNEQKALIAEDKGE